MRTPCFLVAITLAALMALCSAAAAGSLDQSIPWHERSIESRKGKIMENEAILHEYDAELRKLDPASPQTPRRRTEIRIIKRYYTEEIEELKRKIIEHYKAIRDLKAKVGS